MCTTDTRVAGDRAGPEAATKYFDGVLESGAHPITLAWVGGGTDEVGCGANGVAELLSQSAYRNLTRVLG